MAQRYYFIDWAKTIGITIVVLGHYPYYLNIPFCESNIWYIANWVTLFHMPLFFMISGMLHKDADTHTTLMKVKQQLVLPYLYLCAICLVLGTFIQAVQGLFDWKLLLRNIAGIASGADLYGRGNLSYSGPLWFVFSLASIKIVVLCLSKLNKPVRRFVYLLIFVIGGA